jgi:hypothetical protein
VLIACVQATGAVGERLTHAGERAVQAVQVRACVCVSLCVYACVRACVHIRVRTRCR